MYISNGQGLGAAVLRRNPAGRIIPVPQLRARRGFGDSPPGYGGIGTPGASLQSQQDYYKPGGGYSPLGNTFSQFSPAIQADMLGMNGPAANPVQPPIVIPQSELLAAYNAYTPSPYTLTQLEAQPAMASQVSIADAVHVYLGKLLGIPTAPAVDPALAQYSAYNPMAVPVPAVYTPPAAASPSPAPAPPVSLTLNSPLPASTPAPVASYPAATVSATPAASAPLVSGPSTGNPVSDFFNSSLQLGTFQFPLWAAAAVGVGGVFLLTRGGK